MLLALALGTALLSLMLSSQSVGIGQARRAAARVQAEALARGAEARAAAALRRDMAEAPEADALTEPWASALALPAPDGPGRVAVGVRDVRGALDLNGLRGDGAVQAEALRRLVALLDLPPETAEAILAAVARGPLGALDEVVGLDAAAVAGLGPYVALLVPPVPSGAVNLNTAEPLLVEALLGDPRAAGRIVALRDAGGLVTRDDLLDLGVVPAAAVGFASDLWDVTAEAEVDGVAVTVTARLLRRQGPGGFEATAVARRFGAVPGAVPPP